MTARLGLLAAVASVAVALGAQNAAAGTMHLWGGGTESVGNVAFSQVAMNVTTVTRERDGLRHHRCVHRHVSSRSRSRCVRVACVPHPRG